MLALTRCEVRGVREDDRSDQFINISFHRKATLVSDQPTENNSEALVTRSP